MASSHTNPHASDGEYIYESHPQQQQHTPSHYVSTRDMTSPPPQYASSTTPEVHKSDFVSHEEPYTRSYERRSAGTSRDPSPRPYTDRSPSPSPPQPPAHAASPSRRVRTAGQAEHVTRTSRDGQSGIHTTMDRMSSHSPTKRDERQTSRPGFPQQSHLRDSNSPIQSSFAQRPTSRLHEQSSYGSNVPFAGGMMTPGSVTPTGLSDWRSSRYSGHSIAMDEYPPSHANRNSRYSYHDSPYHNSSQIFDATVSSASINPQVIADDADDDFAPIPRSQVRAADSGGINPASTTAPKGGALGGLFGRKSKNQSASGTYRPVSGTSEKSDWLSQENKKRKRNGWLCGIGIGIVIVIAIIGGIVGGVISTRSYKQGSNTNINNANDDTATNGDLSINSAEIKQLLNNPNLHKVFPGMDYTPWGVQYPLCETYPPSQNNVTRDVAVLSQLTNTIRLYGTDCNQTEMVLHAIDRLQLKNIKIWLGVWVDSNQTTTDRQISKMYNVLSSVKDRSIFKGAIVGNEALYRAGADKASSKQQLIQILKNVKANFTSLGYNLPVATSDLGDNWDAELAQAVDYVMANIHPFFAGVSADKAAAWTLNFWNQYNVPLTANLPKVKQLISETGWPSGGGTDCGGADGTCASGQSGATAGVAGINTFMNDWVCQALANGTEYFWFEAFDEPWKIQYNTAGKEWEDKWGLLDAGRNLKSGVKIPNCNGKTVS